MEGFINSKIVSQKTWLQDAVGEAEKCIGANHKYTDLDNAKKSTMQWQKTETEPQALECKAQGIYFESFNFYFQIQSSNKRSDYFQQVTLRVQICLLASSKLLLKVLGSSF